ncbi:hypothetical protein [Halobacteriovorax sp. DPLXC-1]|uniref:hypothetical protein n=1 Tax=Halobacteriovorax sp. DPLXC-1 TaxID=3110771 RepID=UPI002FEF9119
MKILLLTAFFITSSLTFASNDIDNITCALETKRVGGNMSKGRAQQVFQLTIVGENVFRLKSYRGHFFDKGYRATSGGRGSVVELVANADKGYQIRSRTYLSLDFSELQDDVTTGGYPGAGSPPTRINNYSCMINYPKELIDVTRQEVVYDFNL